MPTAVKTNDPIRFPETLRNRKGVIRGEMYYRVRAGSAAHALLADGLPEFGSPWSAELPLVQLAEISPKADPKGGDWWDLKLLYETNSGDFHTPTNNLRLVTEVEQISTSERVYIDLSGKRIGKNGEGTGKMLTAINFRVTDYSDTLPNLDPLLDLSDPPTINANPVILTNILGSGENYNIPVGQLLYTGFSLGRAGHLFRIIHTLHRRRSWQFAQRPFDAAGSPSGDENDIELLDIYKTVSFAGTFPEG